MALPRGAGWAWSLAVGDAEDVRRANHDEDDEVDVDAFEDIGWEDGVLEGVCVGLFVVLGSPWSKLRNFWISGSTGSFGASVVDDGGGGGGGLVI